VSWARRYARFTGFLVTLIVATAAALWFDATESLAHALLIGFDIAAMQFFVTLIPMFRDSDVTHMRQRSMENDPDHHTLLWIGQLVMLVVLVAVFSELHDSRAVSVTLSVATLGLAWVFGNLLFTLHYAHLYYGADEDGDREGLLFPGSDPIPDHWDFAYFAFVLGMTFQVSDVVITGRHMRRLALIHGLLGFIFNIGVIAISVGIIGNLFQPG
jgi:uncharacterized membrane protein